MKFLKYILSVVLILIPSAVYSDSNLANFVIRNHDTNQSPTVGNIAGEYTIVEFFDYRCGYCSKQANDFANILKTRDDTKIIYLEFPIFGGLPVFWWISCFLFSWFWWVSYFPFFFQFSIF